MSSKHRWSYGFYNVQTNRKRSRKQTKYEGCASVSLSIHGAPSVIDGHYKGSRVHAMTDVDGDTSVYMTVARTTFPDGHHHSDIVEYRMRLEYGNVTLEQRDPETREYVPVKVEWN